MPEKFIATDETRTYSFYLTHRDNNYVTIDMYNSCIHLLKRMNSGKIIPAIN
ncbi:MAG TPA: hypothetical protein VGM63_17145 [Mucilaginibacter sp.]